MFSQCVNCLPFCKSLDAQSTGYVSAVEQDSSQKYVYISVIWNRCLKQLVMSSRCSQSRRIPMKKLSSICFNVARVFDQIISIA